MKLVGIENSEKLSGVYKGWIADALDRDKNSREAKWTQSIAVGDKYFVEHVKDRLGFKAVGRKVAGTGDNFELKENVSPYRVNFIGKMGTLSRKNSL